MINAHVSNPTETCQELPQCLEEATLSPESKRQRDERRRIEIIKNWPVTINFHDRGCVVMVGCKSVVFESVVEAIEVVNKYIHNPEFVMKTYGFADYL
jgi:hypothetical protein